ncbi:MAG: heparan-alpha-glucosaminide N-acetyltransferase [Pseudomonadota bacterium]
MALDLRAFKRPPKLTRERLVWIDRARGAALVAMIIYHAFWDALFLGVWAWSPQRDALLGVIAPFIAGSFLAISGLSIALADRACDGPLITNHRFLRRMVFLASAAALITIVTLFALPQAPIYFGVLHHIFVASILLALLVGAHPFFTLSVGAVVLIVHEAVALEAFNTPALIWIGLGTRAPVTADWVPMMPWLAVGCIACALGRAWLLPWLASRPTATADISSWPTYDVLSWMGRHSLAIYLIHQPILIGLLTLVGQLHPAPLA